MTRMIAHLETLLDYFRYPPPFAVAVSPLAACGPRVGGLLWVWLGMGVYLTGLWVFARDVKRWQRRCLMGLGLEAALAILCGGASWGWLWMR